uniref:Nucleotide-diphospho-sugar transferase domain-containing protein n=1 Tax=Acrobeloides nanus TaxID=290746 RepID=A0A914DVX9_9BILA
MANKYLITAVANNGHFEFVLNLIANLNDFGYTKFLIICLDLVLYENLVKYNFAEYAVLVPSTWLPSANISTHEAIWETKDYYPITRSKVFIVNKLVQHGLTILFTDVDIVWLSPNILNYIDAVAPGKDFVYSIDKTEHPASREVNSGFYMVRSNEGGKEIFKAIEERLKVDPDHDQFVINRVFDSNPELLNKHGYRLNKLLFANGDTYFHKQMNKKLGIQPMTIHANYLIGFDKKKCSLIQANMWYL